MHRRSLRERQRAATPGGPRTRGAHASAVSATHDLCQPHMNPPHMPQTQMRNDGRRPVCGPNGFGFPQSHVSPFRHTSMRTRPRRFRLAV